VEHYNCLQNQQLKADFKNVFSLLLTVTKATRAVEDRKPPARTVLPPGE